MAEPIRYTYIQRQVKLIESTLPCATATAAHPRRRFNIMNPTTIPSFPFSAWDEKSFRCPVATIQESSQKFSRMSTMHSLVYYIHSSPDALLALTFHPLSRLHSIKVQLRMFLPHYVLVFVHLQQPNGHENFGPQ